VDRIVQPLQRYTVGRIRVRTKRAPRGFSITELLVVIGVVALLVTLLIPAARMVRKAAAKTRELTTARMLGQAWTHYATDSSGAVLPGFRAGLPAFGPDGAPIPPETFSGSGAAIAARWPWRLTPYLGSDAMNLFAGPQREALLRLRASSDVDRFYYLASLVPSFGLNSAWVGGDSDRLGFLPPTIGGQANPFHNFYVTRLSQVAHPERLTLFASSRMANDFGGDPIGQYFDGAMIEGYFRIDSPWFQARIWADAYSPSDPASSGNVSARADGDAIVVTASGSTEAVPVRQLDDMRRWADQADRIDWRLAP
jgi:prepilin-type N-terminal cleavage/methylation domain-containing protein